MYRRKLSPRTSESETVKDHKLKLTIIAGLCAAAVILFYFVWTSGNSTSNRTADISKINTLSKEKISNDIDSISATFGIHKDWIKPVSQKSKYVKSSEDLLISKEIKIPYDLPAIDLNYEFSNFLRDNYFKERVTEDPKTKNVLMEIYPVSDTSEKLCGIINLVYVDSLKRTASDVCVLIDSIESYSIENTESVLGSTEEFSIYLPLRNDKSDFQSKIIDSKRDYRLKFVISDESDVTADFKIDMLEKVWKAKVKSIAISFPNSGEIILKSKTNYPEFENAVVEEFKKNNITVYKDSIFSQFKPAEQKVNSLFSDIMTRSGSGKKFLFYSVNFNPEEFSYFDKEISKLKKLGYRFYDFKDMINKINKQNSPGINDTGTVSKNNSKSK